MWRVGCGVDLKRAHNPLYRGPELTRDRAKSLVIERDRRHIRTDSSSTWSPDGVLARDSGDELAGALIAAAAGSVGRHHGEVYRVQVRYTCEDLVVLRRRMRELERDIDRLLEQHEIGRLLTTIDGIGPQTAARLVATFGDFSSFPQRRSPGVLRGRRPGAQAIREAHLPAREPHAHRGGPLAGQAVDARAHCGSDESVVASLLRTAHCAGPVAQGRAGGRDEEVAARGLQRRHSSSTVRGQSRHHGGPPVKKSLDGRHGIS